MWQSVCGGGLRFTGVAVWGVVPTAAIVPVPVLLAGAYQHYSGKPALQYYTPNVARAIFSHLQDHLHQKDLRLQRVLPLRAPLRGRRPPACPEPWTSRAFCPISRHVRDDARPPTSFRVGRGCEPRHVLEPVS